MVILTITFWMIIHKPKIHFFLNVNKIFILLSYYCDFLYNFSQIYYPYISLIHLSKKYWIMIFFFMIMIIFYLNNNVSCKRDMHFSKNKEEEEEEEEEENTWIRKMCFNLRYTFSSLFKINIFFKNIFFLLPLFFIQ